MSNNEVDCTNEESMICNEGYNFGFLKSVFLVRCSTPSSLPNGIYFCRIVALDGSSENVKFIVNH
jgi:hypothetical protein